MAAAIPHLKAAFDYSPSYQLGLILSQALMPERRYAEVLNSAVTRLWLSTLATIDKHANRSFR